MNATLADTAAPNNAIEIDAGRMWSDHANILVQLNGSGVYIMKFPLTEGGLSKALNLLKAKKFDFAGVPIPVAKPLDPRIAAGSAALRKLPRR